jgi:hypothetical protein
MNVESLDAKNTAVFPASAGVPCLPSGVRKLSGNNIRY